MKIKTKNKNSTKNYKLIWSYVFTVVLLLSNQISLCQLDSDDNDEVGGSLLSLASPVTNNNNSNSANSLFVNPVQDQINNMAALTKLALENGTLKI